MSTSAVTCVDASPVFEFGEHVLDSVALPIEQTIMVVPGAMLVVGRDAARDALGCGLIMACPEPRTGD